MASRYLEPRLERASRADMARLQLRRLREQVAHAARHSPFYRRKLRGLPPDPAKLRTLDDLRRLPFTTKDELKENQAASPPWGDVLAVPLAEVLRVHLTSATTGRPPSGTASIMRMRARSTPSACERRTWSWPPSPTVRGSATGAVSTPRRTS